MVSFPIRSVSARARQVLLAVAVVSGACTMSLTGLAATSSSPAAAASSGPIAYVLNYGENAVDLINTSTNTVDKTIPFTLAGSDAIAISPDGNFAYIVNNGAGTVTPIDLTTNTVDASVQAFSPTKNDLEVTDNIAITPDGRTAYVASDHAGTVVPIDLTSGTKKSAIHARKAIHAGHGLALAITPNGKTVYVASFSDGTIIPISTATNKPGTPIKLPNNSTPTSVAITPDGTRLYVSALSGKAPFGGEVLPIATATNTVGSSVAVGLIPTAIAVTPDGRTAYVASYGAKGVKGILTPIATATNVAARPVTVGVFPNALTVTPDGKTVYVSNDGPAYNNSSVTAVATATNTVQAPISIFGLLENIAVTPDEAPVAQLSVTPQPAGSGVPTLFDASASQATSSPIVSYAWNFGDGQTAVTNTPTTSHLYSAVNNYVASVTETDAAGTSTSRVFTGQTISLNGGSSAVATANVALVGCPGGATSCASSFTVPPSPTTPAQDVAVAAPAAAGSFDIAYAPASLVCPTEDTSVAPVADLSATGFSSTQPLTISVTLHYTAFANYTADDVSARSFRQDEVCYESSSPFLSSAHPSVAGSGTALLRQCAFTSNVAPCVRPIQKHGRDVIVTFTVPAGQQRFHIVQPHDLVVLVPPRATYGSAQSAAAASPRLRSYSQQITAQYGTPQYRYSLHTSSQYLNGLHISGSGKITGTLPTVSAQAAGDYPMTVIIDDSAVPPREKTKTVYVTLL